MMNHRYKFNIAALSLVVVLLMGLLPSGLAASPGAAPIRAPGSVMGKGWHLAQTGNCPGGLSARQIDDYLRCKNPRSPLIGYGATFMRAGETYNVDPRFVVAIAAAESTFGTNGDCATQHRNAWGYGGGWPSCWNFGTWEEAINQVTMDIGRYYLPNGQNSIPSFVVTPAGTCTHHCWCASGCTNWISIVQRVYAEQGGDPYTNDLTYHGNTNLSGYTFCAWEGERCNFGGTTDVAYGANGQFAYRQNVHNGIDCKNEVFGDPVPGVRKACYIRPVSSQPDYTPPSGYTFCAWEGGRCSFGGTANVAYGANGRFARRSGVSGGIDCKNEVFGDPMPGVRKACYIRPVSSQPDYTPPSGYTFCAWEGERCRFGGTADVAYGANGRFARCSGVRGGIDCKNEVFGDPVPGVRKACYMRPVSSQPDYTPPSGHTFCAWEGERCNFGGTADVAYGANGQFAYRQNVHNGIDCKNEVFGDPVPGVRKACFVKPISAGPAQCPGQYRAEYFANRSLSGSPALVRCEGWPIRHDWAGGSPGSGVPGDGFSARWTGRARIEAGTYTFIAQADDGIRVWLDGNLILDAWRDQPPTEYHVTRDVSAGEHEVRVEYYENGGGALAEFRWERAGASDRCSGTPISLEQRVEGRLSDGTPSVTYCLRASGGQIISARMFALGNDGLDPYLRVLTADGRRLAENDDGLNIGYNSFLSVRLPQDGVYRIVATRYGSTTGRYALRVDRGFEAAVGDLDRDCDVDNEDRDRLRSLLGSTDPNADLDLDGRVSTRDAIFQMRSLGVRCQ